MRQRGLGLCISLGRVRDVLIGWGVLFEKDKSDGEQCMSETDLEVTLVMEHDDEAKKFINELKEAGAPPKLSQANYSGGLAEFVVIGFHWTPMMIESFRALMHKHKPKRLEFKMEGKCKVTVESEGFTDATTTRIIELVLEASRHQ
jgi:hypothetical protein